MNQTRKAYYSVTDPIFKHNGRDERLRYTLKAESSFIVLQYGLESKSARLLYFIYETTLGHDKFYRFSIVDTIKDNSVIQYLHHTDIAIYPHNFENPIWKDSLPLCFMNPHAPSSKEIIWKFWLDMRDHLLEDENPDNWFKKFFPEMWRNEYRDFIHKREEKIKEVLDK